MKTLTITKTHHLAKLHKELVDSGTRLAGTVRPDGLRETDCQLLVNGDSITVHLPDEATQAELDAIATVINAHDPTPPPPPAGKALYDNLKLALDNWSSLTAADKDVALRRTIRAVLAIGKHLKDQEA